MLNIASRIAFLLLAYFFVNISSVLAQSQAFPELGQGQSIQEILKVVADQNQPTPAQLSISLKNGMRFEGVVASFSQSKNTLSMRSEVGEVTLIDSYSISSLTILDPGSALNALRGNRIFRDEKSVIPSRLDLLRRVEVFNVESPVDIKLELGSSELGEKDCRFYTSHIIDEVELLLNGVGVDEHGREAMDKFKNGLSITHKPDSGLSLIGNEDSLLLSFDCKSPLNSDFGETIMTSANQLL